VLSDDADVLGHFLSELVDLVGGFGCCIGGGLFAVASVAVAFGDVLGFETALETSVERFTRRHVAFFGILFWQLSNQVFRFSMVYDFKN
jgi:hypothetical protein